MNPFALWAAVNLFNNMLNNYERLSLETLAQRTRAWMLQGQENDDPQPYPPILFIHPRWAMLALVLLFPLFFLDDVVSALTPRHFCTLGVMCRANLGLPPVAQAAVVGALFLLVWALCWKVGKGPLVPKDAMQGPKNVFANMLWKLSHFERISAPIMIAAGVVVLGLFAGWQAGNLTPQAVVLGLALLILAILTAVWWIMLDLSKGIPTIEQLMEDFQTSSDAMRGWFHFLLRRDVFRRYSARSMEEALKRVLEGQIVDPTLVLERRQMPQSPFWQGRGWPGRGGSRGGGHPGHGPGGSVPYRYGQSPTGAWPPNQGPGGSWPPGQGPQAGGPASPFPSPPSSGVPPPRGRWGRRGKQNRRGNIPPNSGPMTGPPSSAP